VPVGGRRLAHYPKLTVPVPVTAPQLATGTALLLMLHEPLLVLGSMRATIAVMVNDPLIPLYADVPLPPTIGTVTEDTVSLAEQVVALKSVG
jgi:hypothetical protein